MTLQVVLIFITTNLNIIRVLKVKKQILIKTIITIKYVAIIATNDKINIENVQVDNDAKKHYSSVI